MKTVADNLFPVVNYDHGRDTGAPSIVLAWPLFIWTCSLQPLVVVAGDFVCADVRDYSLIIYRWGKVRTAVGMLVRRVGGNDGRYASGKMPHGPFWNRLNMTGQAILFAGVLIAAFRFVSWMAPNSGLGRTSAQLFSGCSVSGRCGR